MLPRSSARGPAFRVARMRARTGSARPTKALRIKAPREANPLRVSIVEDSDDDATMLPWEELRRGGFEVVGLRVETADAMREALVGRTWDLVASDDDLPQFSGLSVMSILKGAGIDVPLMIASGSSR